MVSSRTTLLLSLVAFASAAPRFQKRTVTSLDPAAFAEAQVRDDTATRAFSAVNIKTSDGQCLFVDELSGDFRANLNPIQVGTCDDSTGQKWDVITAGKHNDQAGTALIVNTLTQACMNFDPRRAAGNQVIMFSCGGRADGGGSVTNSQLFGFTGSAGPDALEPENAAGTCFTVKGAVIDQAPCVDGDATQQFSFGDGTASTSATPSAASAAATSSAVPVACSGPPASSPAVASSVASSATSSTAAPVVDPVASSSATPASSSASAAAPPATSAPAGAIPTSNPTTPVPVSRAGGVLDPTAVAEAMVRDDTAVRAFSSVQLKSSSGQCLFIDPTAGDFRENLIPVAVKDCDGSDNEKFDIITSGKHNNVAGAALVVSSLTQGCLNFDPRRAAGDTVILFSCGGRADGGGVVTNSQLFPFTAGATSILLAPENQNGATCLVPNGALLDQATCTGGADQEFTIGA